MAPIPEDNSPDASATRLAGSQTDLKETEDNSSATSATRLAGSQTDLKEAENSSSATSASILAGSETDLEPRTDNSDTDSALGDDDAISTTSLRSSIYNYREENGRTYHSYLESINYVLPNDEGEQDRLDLQHHLFMLTLGGKLYQAPIKDYPNMQRILDAGTGTGVWAMDIGDEFPQAEVFGIDLSPIQPTFVPPNVRFIIDDLEGEWDYPEPFDYVFGRMLVGSIGDWPKFIGQSYDNIRSGGWIELQDIVLRPQCIDDTLKDDSYIKQWSDTMLQATATINRFADSGVHYKQQMIDAGFVNVTEVVYKWPTNSWPKDKLYRALGFFCYHNVACELEGLSMALFTRCLGWTPEAVTVFLTDVRKEMADRSVHVWWPIHVVYGQKP